MTVPTPPRTPVARKTLPGSPFTTTPKSTTSGSPVQKRKWQGGTILLPTQILTQSESARGNANLVQMRLPQKQELDTGLDKKEHQQLSTTASPHQPQKLDPLPTQLQPTVQMTALEIFQQVFLTAFRIEPQLVPPKPTQMPVGSQHIDNIAHGMWQVVFQQESMMKDVTMKASMLPQIKLRALAKLNYLPSWWVLREIALNLMLRQGWLLDDAEMQTLWLKTLEWCKRVETKVGMQGENAPVSKQEA